MKKRNDSGFIHLIVYLLIFVIFAFTLYACLEILDLIEVPEEYSVSKWLSEYRNKDIIKQYEDTSSNFVEKISKKIKFEDSSKKSESDLDKNSIVIEGYGNKFSNDEVQLSQSNKFLYYDQLDNYGKVIYKEIEKNLDNMKSGVYNVEFGTTFDDLLHQEDGEKILNNSFQLAINALNFDNPQLFYIDISKLYLLTRIKTKLWITTYEVEIGASQGQNYLNSTFKSEYDVNNAISDLEYEKKIVKSRINGSTENKIRVVHDYLVNNLEYESTLSKDNIYNIYGALINKLTVCEGYARAFKYLMDDLGIPCVIVCGNGINSSGQNESHAWNYVLLNEKWYAIDVTWDDPVIIGNGNVDSSINYKYYLKGSNEFFKNHMENGNIVGDSNFSYPTLSTNNY